MSQAAVSPVLALARWQLVLCVCVCGFLLAFLPAGGSFFFCRRVYYEPRNLLLRDTLSCIDCFPESSASLKLNV